MPQGVINHLYFKFDDKRHISHQNFGHTIPQIHIAMVIRYPRFWSKWYLILKGYIQATHDQDSPVLTFYDSTPECKASL